MKLILAMALALIAACSNSEREVGSDSLQAPDATYTCDNVVNQVASIFIPAFKGGGPVEQIIYQSALAYACVGKASGTQICANDTQVFPGAAGSHTFLTKKLQIVCGQANSGALTVVNACPGVCAGDGKCLVMPAGAGFIPQSVPLMCGPEGTPIDLETKI